ncbi:hypothetical protein WJX72_006511 [[Myrmecia] bisecta]|uniref:PAS domain-containing protein n=1 Tax=[Myrmecia] bisecta TaxID=41462 RepID=A0AAW1R890_9CHLO
MGGSSFVLVCPPKTLTWDRNRLCAAASVNVPTLSEYIEADTADWPVTSLPGAAVVVEPGDAQTAVLDGCFAVFKGKLDNYAYLVKKYLLSKVEETELVQDVTLDHIKTAAPIQEAELICELYLELGASLVPKLRGSFSFVCYDSKLVRVLAARSNGSPYPLQQAKALDGSLVLLSGPVPVRCHSVHEIGEGFMKFGWSAEPLRYAPCQEDIQAGVAAASAAVAKALQGIEGSQSGELLTVGSLPVTNMEKAKGKTRRGKRAGVKQRERHSLDGGRSLSSSLGSEYGSLGSVRSMSLDRRTSSTRADEHDWWRAQLRPATAAGVYGSPSVASSVDAESPCAMMSSSAPTQGTAGGFMSRGLSHRAQPFSPRAPKTPRTPKQLNSGLRLIPENLSMHDLRQADEPDESQEMEMELDMDMGIDGAAAQQAQHRQSNFTFCVPTNRAAASPFGPLADASPRPGSGFRHTSGFHAPSSSPASEASSWRAQIPQPREPAPVPNLGSDLGHKPPPVRISPPSYGLQSAVSLSSLDTSLMGVLHDLPPHVLEKLAGSVDNDAGSMRMLANLMYSSSCGLVITDATQPDMPIVYVNRVFELRTGYSSAEVLGKNCRFLQAPPGEDRVPSFASMSIRKAIESGKGKSVRILNHHKDGSSLWNDLAIAPLRNREGVMTHHVGMQNFSPAEQQAPAPRPLAQPVPIPRHRGAAVAVFDNGMNTGQVLLQRRGSFGKSKSCTDLAGLQPGGLVLSAY